MNLDHLAQLATEATLKGPWTQGDDGAGVGVSMADEVYAGDGWVCSTEYDSDAAFIAAANPQTVSALVEVARAAKEARWHWEICEEEGEGECCLKANQRFIAKLDNLGGTE